MEPIPGSSVCLICFEMTEKHIVVPSNAPEKLFINCNKYLHSTLTKGALKDIERHNENQVPLCKRCFDSAWELTQLSDQLTTIQKDISDLTVAFSMAVFHRRSQVFSIGQSCKTSSIVEFNEACLPPNLFSMKLGDQNIHPNKNNQKLDINVLDLQTDIDITNVKCETSDIQFDNLSWNPQQSVANDAAEIQFNKDNFDKQCGQPIIEGNQNLESLSEMRIVHVTGRNDSKKCADPNDGMKLTMSDLLKSVKMPKIILERIKIVRHKFDVSVVNSNQTKCESRQKNLDETLFKDDEFSVPSCAPKNPEDGKLLKCFYCKKTFAQECHRTLHHNTHTGDKIYKRPLGKQNFVYRSNQKICEVTQTEKKSFYKKCSYCEKGFSKPNNLQIHERIHTGEKRFECSYCNSRFKQSGDMKRHGRTHTGEKPFKCSYCNSRFNQRVNVKSHERIHTGEKPFKCSYCDSRFNRSSTLKRHEINHTGEKPFKCSYCNTRFKQSGDMKRHESTHTGEKPFKCSYCNSRFKQSGDMKRHESTHTGEKPFKCSYCNSRFKQSGTMKRHERTHTGVKPFKCSYCNSRFNQRVNMKSHERIHTGEKPYKCSYCNSRFNRSSALKLHEINHTGEKPFKCSYCNNRFKQSGDMKRHERTHNSEKPFNNSYQKDHQEQVSSLISPVSTQNEGSLGHFKHQEQMHSTGSMEFKCSFCEMTFNHDEERANHEKIHRREIEFVNENLIVGI